MIRDRSTGDGYSYITSVAPNVQTINLVISASTLARSSVPSASTGSAAKVQPVNPELKTATEAREKPAVTPICLALVVGVPFPFHLSRHLMLSGLMSRKFSWDL